MSRRHLRQAVLAVLGAAPFAVAAGAIAAPAPVLASAPTPAPAPHPTAKQVRKAVAHMQHAPDLWATVNSCDPRGARGAMGVRAQMPALGFPARMSIHTVVQYRDAAGHWRPVAGPNATYTTDLGLVSAGEDQAGSQFAFGGSHGTLRGLVTFTWRRSGRILLRLTRPTTARHPDADGGTPAHYSAAVCVLP